MSKSVMIDGVEYVRADSVASVAPSVDGLPYVVIRTYSAGVHVGYLVSRVGKEVVLRNSRRCWGFRGVGHTGSCTELALHGPDPEIARICEVIPGDITLTEGIEVLPITAVAAARIARCTPND